MSVPCDENGATGRAAGLVLAAWLGLLLVVLGMPYWLDSPTRGDDLTRDTVRLSLACYGTAAALMLRLRPGDWAARSGRGALARWCWTLAWATYLIHVSMAFHYYHHWSHAAAVAHTRQVSGVGEGIYASHLFTLAWTADVAFWWWRPRSYARRAPWVGGLLHGFMVFIIFNATVVYETGFIRWAGGLLLATLAVLWLRRRWQDHLRWAASA